MAHYTIAQINRFKDKVIDHIDQSFEYEKLLKRVRHDIKRFPMGKVVQKYSKSVIQDATGGK